MRYLNAPSSAAIPFVSVLVLSLVLHGCGLLDDKKNVITEMSDTSEQEIVMGSQEPLIMDSMWIPGMLKKDIRNVLEDDDGKLYLGDDIYTYALRSDMAYLYQAYDAYVIEKRNGYIETTGGSVCPPHPDFYTPDQVMDEEYRVYSDPGVRYMRIEISTLRWFVRIINEYNEAVDRCRKDIKKDTGIFGFLWFNM